MQAINDDAPRAGAGGAVVQSGGFKEEDTRVEYLTVLVLTAMVRFPAVLCAARRLGPDLFQPGACRAVAIEIITGSEVDWRTLTRLERARRDRLRLDIVRATIPDTEAWGLSLLIKQADIAHRALLVAQMRWAADEIEQNHPIAHLRGVVNNAFDIALGDAPLDPASDWQVAA